MNDSAAAIRMEAHRAGVCEELARIKALLDREPADAPREATASGNAPIDVIQARCGLSPFERDILLLCAAVELDSGIADRCEALSGRAGDGRATFGLALSLLPGAHWSALTAERPLRRFRLITVEHASTLATSPLRISERVLHLIAGVEDGEDAIPPFVPVSAAKSTHPPVEALRRLIEVLEESGEPCAVQLCGGNRQRREGLAIGWAEASGAALYRVDASALATAPDRNELAALWSREAMLRGAALLIENDASDHGPAVAEFVARLAGRAYIVSREPLELPAEALHFDIDRLSPAPHSRRSTRRERARARLAELAARIEPRARWDDLVLPEESVECLREIVAQVEHRHTVYERWGLAAKTLRGLGITACFDGDSGCGKTTAAEVITNALVDIGMDVQLFKVDCRIESKFIGESARNVRDVFEAAEEAGAVLLFDEADGLFGRRGADGADTTYERYSRGVISQLLQSIESYAATDEGLVILTTNAKSSLDPAFLRRLRFLVHFPFPGATQREHMWRNAFTPATPTEGLDFPRLARLNVSGGGIRNIALNAAFGAAREGRAISMAHLLLAARREFAKVDKVLSDADTRGWA